MTPRAYRWTIDIELKEVLRANVTRDEPVFGGTPIVGPAVDRSPPVSRGRTQVRPFGPLEAGDILNRVSTVPVPGRPTPIPVPQSMPF